MRVACLGGGPAGLYFAIAMKLRDPAHEIVVVERNRPYDTFGWGVVLSDETLANLAASDPESAETIRREFVYWDDIAVFYRGTVTRSSGHGFCGIGRKRLLNILQERAQALGVELRFETEIDGLEPYRGYDLIVAADGANSKVRGALAHVFKPDIDVRACKYIWLGTHAKFDDAFTFVFEETEHGWIWAHAYQFDADTATFIVECSEATWRRFGFDAHEPGGDDRRLREDLRQEPRRPPADDQRPPPARLGLAQLQPRAVRDLVARERRADGRRGGDRALLGRLRHQARAGKRHRARRVPAQPSPPCRRPSGATRTSAAPRCCACRARRATPPSGSSRSSAISHLDPVQFNYSLLTRSQRISHENLRPRDKAWLEGAEMWFEEQATGEKPNRSRPPMFTPFRLRDLHLKNRVVVSPMAQYRAVDGTPDRLASRALRRARQGRRRARLHRDDLRLAGGAHHAGLHRPLCARARGGLEAHRRFHPRRDRREGRDPARPLRAARAPPSSAGRRWMRRCARATGR